MNGTAFPVTPGDVAALTPQEFTFDLDELDGNRCPRWSARPTFMDDAIGPDPVDPFRRAESLVRSNYVMVQLSTGSVTSDACDSRPAFRSTTTGNSKRTTSVQLSRR